MCVHLDRHWEHGSLPLVDLGELQDIAVKLGESGIEGGSFFANQLRDNSDIVDKCFPPHLVKAVPKIFVCP